MSKIIDTFSANSLKVLDRSLEEFIDKYVYNLNIYKKDERAILGQKYHSLICNYINDIDISKIILELDEKQRDIFYGFIKNIADIKKNFIKTEYPFLIKNDLKGKNYYLTGRFDAILCEDDTYTIYDWKTLNIPENAQDDLQSVIYLYCASIIFNSEKIKMKYISVEKSDFIEIKFSDKEHYKKIVDNIIKKYYDSVKSR